MILLLEGGPDIGREALVDTIVKKNPSFRHLPIESLREVLHVHGIGDDAGDQLLFGVACHCANEMRGQDLHVVLSHPSALHMSDFMQERLEEPLLTLHFGTEEDGQSCDYVIDTSKSVNEAYAVVEKIIEEGMKL